jgi:hypothetical protein
MRASSDNVPGGRVACAARNVKNPVHLRRIAVFDARKRVHLSLRAEARPGCTSSRRVALQTLIIKLTPMRSEM